MIFFSRVSFSLCLLFFILLSNLLLKPLGGAGKNSHILSYTHIDMCICDTDEYFDLQLPGQEVVGGAWFVCVPWKVYWKVLKAVVSSQLKHI